MCLSASLGGWRIHCAFNWKLKALITRSGPSAAGQDVTPAPPSLLRRKLGFGGSHPPCHGRKVYTMEITLPPDGGPAARG